jgi:hypothetical protein
VSDFGKCAESIANTEVTMKRKCGVGTEGLLRRRSDTRVFYDKSADVEEKKGFARLLMSLE